MTSRWNCACVAAGLLLFSSSSYAQDPLYDVTDDGVTFLLPTAQDRRINGTIPYTFGTYSYDWALNEIHVEPDTGLANGHSDIYERQLVRRDETNTAFADIFTTYIQVSPEQRGLSKRTERREIGVADIPGAHEKSIIELTQIHPDESMSVAVFYRPRAPKGELTRQTYHFATYDDELNLKAVATTTFDYPRIARALTVFDASQEIGKTQAGTAYIFERVPFMSKKKQDPVMTNYYLVYIDFDGEKVFETSFSFGTKKFAMAERAAFISNGEFKLLAKDIRGGNAIGTIRFEMDGAELSRTGFVPGDIGTENSQSLTGDAARLTASIYFDNWLVSDVLSDEAGNQYIIGQVADWQGFAPVSAVSQEDIFFYKGLIVAILDSSDNFKAVRLFDRWTPQDFDVPATILPLSLKDGNLVLVGEIPDEYGALRLMRANANLRPQISKPLADGVGLFQILERSR